MINVLTIEREYGSGAAAIASKLAERLNWKLWDQLLTDEIARFLECDRRHIEQHEERRDPLHYRLLKSFLRGSFEGSQHTPMMKIADAEEIRKVTEQIVRRAGDQGNAVIVGRGSAYYLRELPNAFHVFVYAPFENKARRLQEEGKDPQEAVDLVSNVDQERSAFIKKHFGIEWPDRQFFNVMVNSKDGEEMVVEIVMSALAGAGKQREHQH